MALEVCQVNHEIVVAQVVAHNVVVQVFAVLDGDAHLAELVHDVDGKAAVKTMLVNRLPVFLHVLPATAVGSVALHDGAVHHVNQIGDEFGLQVVVVAGFAGTDFHSHTAMCFHAQCFIDSHERFGADCAGKIYLRLSHCAHCRQSYGQSHKKFFHCCSFLWWYGKTIESAYLPQVSKLIFCCKINSFIAHFHYTFFF